MSAFSEYLCTLQGKTVAVIGAGVSNLPLVRLLRQANLTVCVHDKKDAAALGEIYQTLCDLGATCTLGEGYLDDLPEQVIFRTPGLHPNHPALTAARARGAVVTSEMELFFAVCPCPVLGITGSDGKTTTTTLVYEFLTAAGLHCHLGGNIGAPLLPNVEQMQPTDFAVVELSSFQLMGMGYSPQTAAITNLTPNHLDYHADFDEYVQAKTAIYAHQSPNHRLILNLDDAVTQTLDTASAGNIAYISLTTPVEHGVFLQDGIIQIAENGTVRPLMAAADIRIPGVHNVYNVMMATAIVQGLCPDAAIAHVCKTFGGVAHRIEYVRTVNGVAYYNDSIASSPTRTMAGLNAFPQKVMLIAGGYDKHIPYDVLGNPICDHVHTLILTGATAPKIQAAVENATACEKPHIYALSSLAEAVQKAHDLAQEGDVVIMSPASASFDCFKNFAERGDVFKALVEKL